MERREIGFVVGLMGLSIFVELVHKHLAFSMAIVVIVAAIGVDLLLLVLVFLNFRQWIDGETEGCEKLQDQKESGGSQ